MNIAIISLTEKGRILSWKIADNLRGDFDVTRFCFEKNCDDNSRKYPDIHKLTADIFSDFRALIYVCACGIAVRSIAPFIKSKATDPAVLVIDDCGKFVIPILSGHIGGANRLSEIIAEKISTVPVITTATDVGGKFSPDSFAMANNLVISSLNAAKEIASAVLSGEKIGIKSDYPYKNLPREFAENSSCCTGVCISGSSAEKPFSVTLNLMPKNLVIGIGCKRETSREKIEEQISKARINIKRVCAIATIDIKSKEKGLLDFCEKHGFKLFSYTAEQLMSVSGNFTKSDFVLAKTGADNICERAAVLHSGGVLVLPKFAGNGVTLAAAENPVLLDFERKVL